jgi:hypothetical protein
MAGVISRSARPGHRHAAIIVDRDDARSWTNDAHVGKTTFDRRQVDDQS